MKRLLTITKFGLIFFLIFSSIWCFAAEQAVISVIFSSDITPYQQAWQGFKEFFDKKKISLLSSKYNLSYQRPELIYPKIKEKKPELILTLGSKATRLAKQKIKDIPVVFSMILTPEAMINSNITGSSLVIPVRMQLREIKKILPNVKKIGIIYSPERTSLQREILEASKELDYQIVFRKIISGKYLPEAFNEISWQIDCFLMTPDTEIYFPESVKYLLMEGAKRKLPVVGLSSYYTRAGALISFECDYMDLGRQSAEIAMKILDGQSPTTISLAEPRKIKFSLNLLTAEELGLEIPKEIIKQASEVFGK